MKLEGSLDAFGLPDVLHLLHATAKTGALHLTRQGAGAAVHLIDGSVVSGATTDAGRLALLRRLVGQGLVDEDMVASAAMAAAETGDGLVATLVSSDLIDADVAQTHMHHLIVDTLFEVVRWDDGDFSFAAEEVPTDDVGVRQPPGVVVEEATLRLPAWEAAADHVPSLAHVPGLSRTQPHELSLTPEDWSLLALVDAHRTVDELVAESGLGAFAVVVRLADLCQRGCVEMFVDREAAGARQAARREVLTLLDAAEGIESGASAAASESEIESTVRSKVADAELPASGGSTVISVPVDGTVEDPGAARTSPATTTSSASPRGIDPDASLLGGAHQPGDVVPPRPEPFLPSRQPEHPETLRHQSMDPADTATHVQVVGANAVVATPARHDDMADVAAGVPLNRSMVLRLIAGVRGL